MIARYNNKNDALNFVRFHAVKQYTVIRGATNLYWVVEQGAAKWLVEKPGFEVVDA